MKPVATTAQMRDCDRITIEEFGLPGVVLMESASRAVATKARELLGGEAKGRRVTIICGKGNNGGDGLAVARHLRGWGAEVAVFLAGRIDALQDDPQLNAQLLLKCGVTISEVTGSMEIPPFAWDCDLVVDALLGTGFSGPVGGLYADLIDAVSRARKPVLAVDIPSGVNGDSGQVAGAAVKARATVTFGLLKPGLLIPPGRDLAGVVEVADIGIPSSVVERQGIALRQVEAADIAAVLPHRRPDAHKGNAGFVYILAGSPGLTGAAALAAEAAVRSGAGLVVVGVSQSLNAILEVKLTEAMTEPLPETPHGALSAMAWEKVARRLEWADAIAFGPGVGTDPETGELLARLLENALKPLVIDADGLNQLAARPELLSRLPRETVLTPHPGELSRLTGLPVAEILSRRIEVARDCARRWGVVLHLKSSPSLTATPGGEVFLNSTGNAGMATGGSGDVLTGIIAALLAGGVSAAEAAWAGAFLHGAAGDQARDRMGEPGMSASDIILNLPTTWSGLS